MLKKALQESVESNHACEYSADSEIFTGDVKKIRIQVLHFENSMNLVEGHFDDLLICQFFLNVEKIVHKLTDIPNCIREDGDPLLDIDVFRGLADVCINE